MYGWKGGGEARLGRGRETAPDAEAREDGAAQVGLYVLRACVTRGVNATTRRVGLGRQAYMVHLTFGEAMAVGQAVADHGPAVVDGVHHERVDTDAQRDGPAARATDGGNKDEWLVWPCGDHTVKLESAVCH